MKTTDPMPQLRQIFTGNRPVSWVLAAVKTRGKARVEIISQANDNYLITFRLKKVVKGQTFLGIYPARTTLPDADGLAIGDYALLQSGEVIQIL
jgi:hypothetical protein